MSSCKYLAISLFMLASGLVYAQTPVALKACLPEVPGWTIANEAEIFSPDNLFDRINGAAPLFIENNFREMTSLEYKKGDDYITIQAYRHATPADAFGMYSAERSSDLTYLPIGGEAQGDDKNLYFFAGSVYVKMWTSSDAATEALRQVGSALAQCIDPQADYPSLLKLFPAEGKQPYTESYITASYIGHEFLKSAYVATYKNPADQPFQLFLIDAQSNEGAEEILKAYFTFTKQPLDYQEGTLLIKDRYNGDIPALWKGQYIIGVFNENGDTIEGADSFINQLAKSL
ncbi:MULTISPECIES: DUF6599 family protein [unclassified Parabacteroides]|uniref:DUF6599 family protein n=1 Tax=unclassified Parabacteroides TaxID=2649774 RepID=UPI002474E91E|nr:MULTISPECIES: DUF6599 family protein [unclassified Parabacteroides]